MTRAARLRGPLARPRRRPGRAGFTIVETIVAIMVLGVGLLGMAGTAAYVASQMGTGNRQAVAANVAQAVLDSLTARPCAGLVSGSDSVRTIAVAWTVTDSNDAKYVRQSVKFNTGKGVRRTVSFNSMITCRD